jgi:two-component system cell cycle response regulator
MPITVLAIDDEPNTLGVLQIMIEMDRPDWRFLTAYDGETGIQIAEQEAVDFILLDIMMPGLDGFETCRRLRASPKSAHVPIVMFTALDTPERRKQSTVVGADDFWVKPFRPGVFIGAMEKIIAQKTA